MPRRDWSPGPRFVRHIALVAAGAVAIMGVVAGLIVVLFLAAIGVVPVGFRFHVAADVLLVLVVVAVVAGVRTLARGARRFGAPVAQLVDAAGRIEAGDYSARLTEPRQPQLRRVARSFNSMSARLEAIDSGRRAFLADVAHELRTPLAVIRGQAEAIADGLYAADHEHLAPILTATSALERLVDDLRTLSLAQSGALPLRREPVDAGMLAASVVAELAPLATPAAVRVLLDIAPGLTVDADPGRLATVLQNLLSNAIAHSPPGATVTVSGRGSGSDAVLRIEDEGAGVPAELLPRLFDRFVKGPSSTGSGLGLAIAREVVVAHGGRLEARNRERGGACFEVTLPVAG